MLKTLNVPTQFVDGLRVTDAAVMEVAQMVLCGSINKEISSSISQKRGVLGAVGLSGLDAGIIMGKKKDPRLGLVGEPVGVNAALLKSLLQAGLIPVIAPVGTDVEGGGPLNINADTAAGAVAEALSADVFLLLTDIAGVLDKDKKLMERIPSGSLQGLKDDGTISGGMIPKLETAAQVGVMS
jgi:acetylglutamate kinase